MFKTGHSRIKNILQSAPRLQCYDLVHGKLAPAPSANLPSALAEGKHVRINPRSRKRLIDADSSSNVAASSAHPTLQDLQGMGMALSSRNLTRLTLLKAYERPSHEFPHGGCLCCLRRSLSSSCLTRGLEPASNTLAKGNPSATCSFASGC